MSNIIGALIIFLGLAVYVLAYLNTPPTQSEIEAYGATPSPWGIENPNLWGN